MDIEQEIIKMAISNGIFALLFVWLLITERKNSQVREDKLTQQLENNTEAIKSLRDLILFSIKSNTKEENK
ncbi:BhlA/UviB family holin-like peptide [Desulfotomaculum nigrificans]|uniref:BhlA/UviB family holin-like peptide n=1 Tax=Desulfotomaculum nigrificans TaxID=1565 RepID=UPI0001FAECE6|nr:BhlA/UviB family holin-like peptide [Desulfotomaculum nigrificans]